MKANSASVSGGQQAIHTRLDEIVRRHLAHAWRAPVHEPTRLAIGTLLAEIDGARQPLILDAGCGDGSSTLRLASENPHALVIGLDKSTLRLQRWAPEGFARHGNAVLVRAEIADAWRLLAQAGIRLSMHYLLYPNPWPKSAHLQRRWHGHPAFPYLLVLGGQLELRSNWRVYADELAEALRIAGHRCEIGQLRPGSQALTPFEQKYRDSNHALWRLTCNLDTAPGS
jgi:tRNA G46 methylase TrmB